MKLINKLKITLLLAFICLTMFADQAIAQQNQTNLQNSNTVNKAETTNEVKIADIAITANVTARELKFEVVPNPTVEFTGKYERKTFWEAKRQGNLPESVQSGVTYRNVGIQLRITSRFADIERIVAEALGEISTSEDKTRNQTSKSLPLASSNVEIKKTNSAVNKKR